MGQPLDNIVKKLLILTNEIISNGWRSSPGDIGRIEDDFSIQFTYEGLTGTLTSTLEYSSDGVNYVPDESSSVTFTDATGTHIYDIAGSGTEFVKVCFSGGGTATLTSMLLVGGRRH